MKKILLIAAMIAATAVTASAQVVDTLHLSTLYTTHIVFSTDVTYAQLSKSSLVNAKVVEQNKNMLALQAKMPFESTCSVSALEANGKLHTFIIVFDEQPQSLIIDTRVSDSAEITGTESVVVARDGNTAQKEDCVESNDKKKAGKGKTVSLLRKADAPVLSDVVKLDREIFHIGARDYDIEALCENILVYSDITYINLSVKNSSHISYEINDATFVIESKRNSKRTVKYETSIFPKSKYGTLTAGANETAHICYSFDKITLTRSQVLKCYLYETGGQRNLVMTFNTKDINRAKSTF